MTPSQDDTRFIEALTRHQAALEAFCHANLANREDAREVLQATCVKLWQKAADWNPDTEFLPWAFTVARFTILSHYRDQKRDRLVFDEDVIKAMADEIEEAAPIRTSSHLLSRVVLGEVRVGRNAFSKKTRVLDKKKTLYLMEIKYNPTSTHRVKRVKSVAFTNISRHALSNSENPSRFQQICGNNMKHTLLQHMKIILT